MSRNYQNSDEWKCTGGHDLCNQMLPSPTCPYCEGPQHRLPAPIDSGFAILDVKRGRAKLAKQFEKTENLRIPVVIRGHIYGQHSRDDGVSIEFSVQVESAEEVCSEVSAP